LGGNHVPGPLDPLIEALKKRDREFEARNSEGQRLFYLKLFNRVNNHGSLRGE
jgi:hypothetical protein